MHSLECSFGVQQQSIHICIQEIASPMDQSQAKSSQPFFFKRSVPKRFSCSGIARPFRYSAKGRQRGGLVVAGYFLWWQRYRAIKPVELAPRRLGEAPWKHGTTSTICTCPCVCPRNSIVHAFHTCSAPVQRYTCTSKYTDKTRRGMPDKALLLVQV